MNTPLHLLILAHTFGYTHTHTQVQLDTLTPLGASRWYKLTHMHTAAQTHTWVIWPQVQWENQESEHLEITDLLICPRWACFMFKMSSHDITDETLPLRHKVWDTEHALKTQVSFKWTLTSELKRWISLRSNLFLITLFAAAPPCKILQDSIKVSKSYDQDVLSSF